MKQPILALRLVLAPLAGQAADFPTRPIDLFVPNLPGGMNDITARPLANVMQACGPCAMRSARRHAIHSS